MDYLNKKKIQRQKITLLVGYVLIAIMIFLATLILIYITEGYRIAKNGIVQSGLVFLDSRPNPANVYINNKLQSVKTNTSFLLPSGQYDIKITAKGYLTWQRKIVVIGGAVQYYDYPFLFPKHLVTTNLNVFTSMPLFATQSPSRQYLMIESPSDATNFDIFDLDSPGSGANVISIPTNVLYPTTIPSTISSQSWSLVQWSTDNQHVVLNYTYNGNTEFILVDINNPADSVNLSSVFSNYNFNSLSLVNNQYNLYDLYNTQTKVLEEVNLNSPLVTLLTLTQVLGYKTYGTNTILYATTLNAPSGQAIINEQIGTTNYFIKKTSLASTYLLDLADYQNVQYVAVGQSNQPIIDIYQAPVNQILNDPDQKPFPIAVLRVTNPNYLSFSDNAQFIVAEDNQNFAIYNELSGFSYRYRINYPLQSPQLHASWMNGDQLVYISNNHLIVFDYNDQNLHVLEPASSNFLPFFSTNYNYIFTLVDKKNLGYLTQTATFVP